MCISGRQCFTNFALRREKGLGSFLTKRKSKHSRFKIINVDFKVSNVWFAHYVCVNERLHLSWHEIFTHTGLQGDLLIKNLSQIDLFSAILYSYFNFCYQKSMSAEYLHRCILTVQQTAISLTHSLSSTWAHTEVIKLMYSGTYNNTNSETYWDLRK